MNDIDRACHDKSTAVLTERVNALKQIISTGACGINPPLMGWLLEAGIMTPAGFDQDRARAVLQDLAGDEKAS